jgi:hypothetical protein
MTIHVRHMCSVDSLIQILASGKFEPCNFSPYGVFSGISGYIVGEKYANQIHVGDGAELIIRWSQTVKVWADREHFPLTPDTLYCQKFLRAFIPMGTQASNIEVIGFNITAPKLSLIQRVEFGLLRRKLEKQQIHLSIETERVNEIGLCKRLINNL